MIYLYGVALVVALYFVIREAVEAGVKGALSSADANVLIEAIKLGVAQGIEMDRTDREFTEEN